MQLLAQRGANVPFVGTGVPTVSFSALSSNAIYSMIITYGGGGGGGGVSAATATNIAAQQALIATNVLASSNVVFGGTITGNGSGLTNVNETVESLTYSGSTVTIDWGKSFGRLTVTKATTLDVSNIASNSFGHVYRLLCVQDSAGTWAVTPSTNHIRTQGGSVNGWIPNPTNAGAEFTIELTTGFYGTNIYAGQSGAAWLP